MASAASIAMKCSRCHAASHCTTDCHRPFLRKHSVAEDRILRANAQAQKKAQWELRQVEAAKKRAAWESRTAQRKATLQVHQADWELESCCTETTVSTVASTGPTDEEVTRLAMMNKEVRRLNKVLREITKLEVCGNLDELQRAKVARKHEVEVELDTALGLAKARARNELRHAKKE